MKDVVTYVSLPTVLIGYKMQVDTMGPLQLSWFSGLFHVMSEAYGIPNQEATTVAEKLVTQMLCWRSPPNQRLSDIGIMELFLTEHCSTCCQPR